MTAGERLQQLSGLAGVSAVAMLLAIGTGATAGAALVEYSGLPNGTAAVHLLTEQEEAPPPSSGASLADLSSPGASARYRYRLRRRRRRLDEETLLAITH